MLHSGDAQTCTEHKLHFDPTQSTPFSFMSVNGSFSKKASSKNVNDDANGGLLPKKS
jgi:hypothetical protein